MARSAIRFNPAPAKFRLLPFEAISSALAVATPDDDERTVAERARTVAEVPAAVSARAKTQEEATRVEPPPRLEDAAGGATEVASSGEMPVLKEIRARARAERSKGDGERLAPPVPPSPPRGPSAPVPSAPTDPAGVSPFHPSAPTTPNPIISDEEATRLAPKADKKKAPPRPAPPLVRRPVARQALQRLKHFTKEVSAVSIASKSVVRRRTSRVFLALLAALVLVGAIQLVKAFTSNNAELARPIGGKKVEEPDFFDKLFKF